MLVTSGFQKVLTQVGSLLLPNGAIEPMPDAFGTSCSDLDDLEGRFADLRGRRAFLECTKRIHYGAFLPQSKGTAAHVALSTAVFFGVRRSHC